MNFIRELRELAMVELRDPTKRALKGAADELQATTEAFKHNPSKGELTALNAAWARAERVKKLAQAVPEPEPPVSTQLREAA